MTPHPRLQKLYEIIEHAGLDAVALNPGANLRYLTGIEFHLMERALIVFFVPGRNPVAVLPGLEQDRLAESGLQAEMFPWSDDEGPHAALAAAAQSLNLGSKQLGVEELRMRLMESALIEGLMPGVRLVQAGESLTRLRLHKDAGELAALRQAIALSESALKTCIASICAGQTEREIANTLIMEQLKRGGGPHPFEPIVLSGPRAALPHGEPGERRIQSGEPLLFDFGTTVQGYASDITRTFCVGEPSARLSEVYSVVQAANAAGREAIRPGVPIEEVDRAARRVVEAAGFGPYFTHRTGHGLGLEPHEPPGIVAGNRALLEPGMVFTVEPGIYLPGEVGVRIEDNMVVTEDGHESLTTFPRELLSIGV